jgi:mannose-6-phosphate isomerase-like protein (cupin superfamily)
MDGSHSRAFDFDRRIADCEESTELVRKFASAGPLRSAMVEELELNRDSYRRPARPEDLSFIDFSQPSTAGSATQLPFLASQRLLFAINEQRSVRLPSKREREGEREFVEYYADSSRELGRRIAPFLEDFAFSFIEPYDIRHSMTAATERLETVANRIARSYRATLRRVNEHQYLQEGLRFLFLQEWSLLGSRRAAIRIADAAGFFDGLPAVRRPRLDEDLDVALANIADKCGVVKAEHSYWQFYLSSSLARCNILHALAQRPLYSLRLIGASYVAMAAWLAFISEACEIAKRLGLAVDREPRSAGALLESFRDTVQAIDRRCGAWGIREISVGVAMAETLIDCSLHDIDQQLKWLSSLDRYQRFAYMIDERIRREVPNIDRETFVEPREMCSTTHVHDDHRLVVIESGKMVFWGNLGMTLRLRPGEMVLVPKGRLHGSSIESDNCVYHQPIIPDAWIDAMLQQAENEPVH